MFNGVLGTWVRFGTGLPDIDVMNMELNPFTRIITVATMGRGTWQATF